MTQVQWRGVFPALTTKFTAADEIDWDAMGQHLEFQLDAGVHGLIILGSLGENATLSPEEKLETVRFFARAERRGLPLIACIAESSTREARESAADTRRFPEIRRHTGDRFALFCGVDDLALECFALGAVGWVAGLVVAFPRETVRIWELCQAGNWNEARRLYEWFLPLLHLDIGPKFVQQIKLVEALMGVGSAKVRAPRLQLTEAEASRVEKTLADALEQRPEM